MASPDSERVKAWRAANPDRYREYQRDLMRQRRQKAKETAQPAAEQPGGVLAPVKAEA
jgi:hypothetical protein